MDPTGCPPGWATDNVFNIVRPGMARCQDSLALYWGLVVPALFVRVLLSILQIRIALYLTKTRKEAHAGNGGKEERIPLTTVLEMAYTVSVCILWCIWGANISSAANGTGPALYALASFPLWISFYLIFLKLVHLGDKILPKKVRNQLSKLNNQETQVDLSSIRADPVLSILFFFYILSLAVIFAVQVVVELVVETGKTDLWFRIGMGFGAVLAVAGGSIVVRQTFRLVDYIENVHKKQMKNISGGNIDKLLDRTMKAMRYRSYAFGFSTAACAAALGVCASGIFIPWWFMFMLYLLAQVGATGSTLMYKPASMSMCWCFGGKVTKDKTLSKPSSDRTGNDTGKADNNTFVSPGTGGENSAIVAVELVESQSSP